MKLFLILIAILCLLIFRVIVFVWLCVYNVSARVPHSKVTHWFMRKVRDQSISAHNKRISFPSLKDPKLIDIVFKNYHVMCQLCHNIHDYSYTEIVKCLNPNPPEFIQKDTKWRNDAELYWVVKNGIKMTGMPAFGLTHSKDELWGIVTFLRRLPEMQAEEL